LPSQFVKVGRNRIFDFVGETYLTHNDVQVQRVYFLQHRENLRRKRIKALSVS